MSVPKRKTFTKEEDALLEMYVQLYGRNSWHMISNYLKTRSERQCRDRWENFLNPTLNKSEWSIDEDRLLLEKYNYIGPIWKRIAAFFPNRSYVSVKNRGMMLLRKARKIQRSQEADVYQEDEDLFNEFFEMPEINF